MLITANFDMYGSFVKFPDERGHLLTMCKTDL